MTEKKVGKRGRKNWKEWGSALTAGFLCAVVTVGLFVIVIGIPNGARPGNSDGDSRTMRSFEEEIQAKLDPDKAVSLYGAVAALAIIGAAACVFMIRNRDKRENLNREEKIRISLERDALTGLFNRNLAKELIEKELTRKDSFMAFLMLDLDGLKRINDTYGHDVGDLVISTFAGALADFFGNDTIIARVGGDEFICFLKNAVDEKTLKQSLRQFLRKLLEYAEVGIVFSCSIGVTTVKDTNRDFSVLFKQADIALYYVKNNGKNGYAFFRKNLENQMLQHHKNIIEIYKPDEEIPYDKKAHYDYKDVLIWLFDNYGIESPEKMLLKDTNDFIMLINPDSLDVLDVISTDAAKESRLFEDFVGKKCYEAFNGARKMCEQCPLSVCNHRAYTFLTKHSDVLNGDFIERSTIEDIGGEACLVHTYRNITDSDSWHDAFVEATGIQNFVTSCAYCDTDPVLDPLKYFTYEIRTCCFFYGAESGYIIRMDGNMETAVYNIEPELAPSFKVDMSAYAAQNWKTKLDMNFIVYLDDVNRLETTAPKVYEFFMDSGVRNSCIVPIWDGVRIYGYLCLRNITRKKDELYTLCTVSGVLRDAMKRISEHEESINRRYYDDTTGYLNYEGFKRQISTMDLYDGQVKYAICAWDIRRFKYINEAFGHTVGNSLLNEMADAFARKLDHDEYICRVAGDNFCALCVDNGLEKLRERFVALAESVTNYFSVNYNGKFDIEMSIGIYQINPKERIDVDQMVNMAGIAEKKAKMIKGTTILFFDDEMREKTRREVMLAGELDQALRHNEFQIYLQPQVYIGNTKDGNGNEILRAEVLCRWIRDGKVYASPVEFIPIFEESGKINILDLYMLKSACELLQRLRKTENIRLRLAVNISRFTLLRNEFIREYDEIVKKYNVSESELELEFTEGIAVTDFDKFYDVLEELKKRGCLCAMDDFGSDYSSLNVLQKLPIDVLKLDKKFFESGRDSRRHNTIVEDTIRMAKDLNMQTIAEGIEEEKQVANLKAAECDYIQGFVFAKPMPVDEYLKWAKKRFSSKQ